MTIKDDLLPEEQSWGFYFCLYPFGRPIHGGFIVLPRYIGIKEAGWLSGLALIGQTHRFSEEKQ